MLHWNVFHEFQPIGGVAARAPLDPAAPAAPPPPPPFPLARLPCPQSRSSPVPGAASRARGSALSGRPPGAACSRSRHLSRATGAARRADGSAGSARAAARRASAACRAARGRGSAGAPRAPALGPSATRRRGPACWIAPARSGRRIPSSPRSCTPPIRPTGQRRAEGIGEPRRAAENDDRIENNWRYVARFVRKRARLLRSRTT